MSKRTGISDIPGWVHGLWMQWAEIKRVGGVEAWVAMMSDTPAQAQAFCRSVGIALGEGRPCGPVEALAMALDSAHAESYRIAETLFAELPPEEKTAIYYRYSECREWGEVPGLTAVKAFRRGLSASIKLRDRVLGLGQWKGDDDAAWGVVEAGRLMRAACNA